MDERFPKWLRVVVAKLDFIGIPNLAPLICGFFVLAFLAKTLGSSPYQTLIFDPVRVLQGDWWRIFLFPVSDSMTDPLWFIFYVLILYFFIQSLEGLWGAGPITVYMGLVYLCALAASFYVLSPVPLSEIVLDNVTLAFGTLFPDTELYVLFILPVKAKWFAWLAGALTLIKFATVGSYGKVYVLLTVLPFILFFLPMGIRTLRTRKLVRKHRQRFDKDMWR